MNVALATEEVAGLQMLRALTGSGHQLVAVLTTPPKPGAIAASVWDVARSSGFQTWPAKLVRDPRLADLLHSAHVDILLNVYSLYIVHRDVLAAPRLGAFNLHPGPLPRYAGLNAVSWAIYRGEETHGVTVHKMESEIDAGPIVYQSFFPIGDSATGLSVSFKCVREGVKLILKLLEVASTAPDRIPLSPQDLKRREYFSARAPNNCQISWSSPVRMVLNFVRACDYLPFRSPWGHPRTQFGDREISVIKTEATGRGCNALPGTVGRHVDSGVLVACLDEWVLVKQLKIDDKHVPAAHVLKFGDHLGCETNGHSFTETTGYAGS